MKFKYKLLPALVSVALGAMTGGAGAVPLTTQSASETGTGADVSTLNGVPISANSQTATVPTGTSSSVDVLDSFNNASNSSAFFHTYGTVGPGSVFFGSRTTGNRVYDLTSPYHLSQDFLTPAAGAPTFFTFVVDNGELSAYCSPCSGGGSAMISILIGLDGTTVASGTGTLSVASNGSTSLSTSGLVSQLNGIAANGTTTGAANPLALNYGWSPTSFTVDLGTLSGQHTLTYDLITKATGDFASDTLCSSPYGPAVGAIGVTGSIGAACGLGNTTARAGDPFPPGTNGPTGAVGLQVPEPATLALLGAGLAGLGATRKRKRGKPNSGA